MREGNRTRELPGLALLACAVLFGLILLAPELRIGRHPLNDNVLHLAAAERLGASLAAGEPFLDPWVSEWSLGYPVWRSYQPLPHLLAAAVLGISGAAGDHASAFAALHYLLLALLPASVYSGARMLGLTPVAAGLASILVLMPSSLGEYGRYGIGYGATAWRGSGLFTQVVGLHFLVLSIGAIARALDTGRRRALASALLAAAALSHIVFGYVGFVSAVLLAAVGPKGRRARRLVRLATILLPALLLLLWFAVPLLLGRAEVNHSRWEAPYKWDSYGAPEILREIASGRFFDAGRPPILSTLVLLGALTACFQTRDSLARRLLALTLFWLALFFGRNTWGHLLLLLGVPSDLHLHRLQAVFELSGVLLAGWGIASVVRWPASLPRAGPDRSAAILFAALSAIGLAVIGRDRAAYLGENAAWGERSLGEIERADGDIDGALDLVRSILEERPGRASAGKASTWGKQFRIGSVPFYAFLTREHIDQVSFLYHSMSLPSDIMMERNESDGTNDTALGVRAVVAPAEREMPAHLRLRGRTSRFAVYESSREGYFGLVDIAGRYTGPRSTNYEPNSAWFRSRALRQGIVYALDGDASFAPGFGRWRPLPEAPGNLLTHRGHVVSESKEGETYRARVDLERPCHAFVKLTWHPDLRATVDGEPAPLIPVTPGFGAVAVGAGQHEVVVRYAPGPLKPALFWAGLATFAALAVASGRRERKVPAHLEDAAAERLARLGAHLVQPRFATALLLFALALLALRPLARGKLVDGHDAAEYPPRLVEFAAALGDGQLPPVWAPDLGAGHGQPLFGFAPPLVYAAALPFQASGLRLADSINFGLFLLHLAGAIAMYRLGRALGASREASLAGAGAWLFVPYLALDLFVRAAFAESAAFAVGPVALLGVVLAVRRPGARSVALGAAGVSLVLLSHNAAALLLVPLLALVAGALVLDTRRCGTSAGPRRAAASGFGALAAGLGLSAFFWVPALGERDFVKVELLRQGFLHWREHAISPFQLLSGRWGYGLSGPGTPDGMSFALGPLHLALAVLGAVLASRHGKVAWPRAAYTAFAIAALFGAWLATTWSSAAWEVVGPLQYFAYPWRALLLPGLLLPILALPAFERLGNRSRIGVATALLVANLPHTEPKGYLAFDDEFYAPRSIAEKGLNTSTREEYEPRWVESRPAYSEPRLVGSALPVETRALSLGATRQEWTVSATAPTRLEANPFFFPGWRATIDGVAVPVAPTPVTGTLSFSVPAGDRHVVLEFGRTPLRQASLLASAVTFLGLGAWLAVAVLRNRSRYRGAWSVRG
jgi:hypothetical protein